MARRSSARRSSSSCDVGYLRTMPVLALLLSLVLLVGACGGSDTVSDPDAVRTDGPEHVHGLGVNPSDGALMVATHSGLFRLARGDRTLRRVGDLRQDTMGLTVVGPDRFLGSGHPDARTSDPPQLGLIESRDAGRSWRSVSLRGDADLHALAAHSHIIYAFDSLSGQLIASASGGRSWTGRRSPGPVVALALDPSSRRGWRRRPTRRCSSRPTRAPPGRSVQGLSPACSPGRVRGSSCTSRRMGSSA